MPLRPAAPVLAAVLALAHPAAAGCRGESARVSPRGAGAMAERAVARETAVAGVRAAFAAYKAAATAGDGPAAAALVDTTTAAYYARALALARTAPEAEVRALPLLDRFVVLSVRHRIEPARLAALDGRGLVAAGVAGGWIGREGTGHMELGAVVVRHGRAAAPMLVDGRPAPFHLDFRRENGRWHVDLTALNAPTGEALEAAAAQSGLAPDAFLEAVLAQATGRPVPPTLWAPPTP